MASSRLFCVSLYVWLFVHILAQETAYVSYINYTTYPFDGVGLVPDNAGSSGTPLTRTYVGAAYSDSVSNPSGDLSIDAWNVLTELLMSTDESLSSVEMSQFWVYWGMLVYFDLVDIREGTEDFSIVVDDSATTDEQCTCTCDIQPLTTTTIPYTRAARLDVDGVQNPVNNATTFIDLDNIYGRSQEEADKYRTFEGGHMNLTPDGLPQLVIDDETGEMKWLIADQRSAGNLGSLAVHTLLLREHNRYIDNVLIPANLELWNAAFPYAGVLGWSDEDYYQAARLWTLAVVQHIHLYEYVPQLLAAPTSIKLETDLTLPVPDLYDPSIDTFTALALKWPFYALGYYDRFIDDTWAPVKSLDSYVLGGQTCDVSAQNAIIGTYGLDPFFRGSVVGSAIELNSRLPPAAMTSCFLDPLLTIQQGRDYGVPLYNQVRAAYNLPEATAFSDISSNINTQQKLAAVYNNNISSVDAIVGAMLEDGKNVSHGGILGETLYNALYRYHAKLFFSDPQFHRTNNQLTDHRDINIGQLISQNSDYNHTFLQGTGDGLATFVVDALHITQASYEGSSDDGSISLSPGVFELQYTADKGSNLITFTAKFWGMGDNGYMAIGVNTAGVMDKADIFFFCEIYNDASGVRTAKITDKYGQGNQTPQTDTYSPADTLLIEYGWSAGLDTVKFSRAITYPGSDTQDQDINLESQYMIWSYNTVAVLQHGAAGRGAVLTSFTANTSSAIDSGSGTASFFVLHGVVMLLAWGFAAPAGVWIVRYKKHWTLWMDVHEFLASFAAQSAVPIAIAALTQTKGHLPTTHGKLGFALMIVLILQLISGRIRVWGLSNVLTRYLGNNYGKFHQDNKRYHRWMGRLVTFFAIVNCYYGLKLISPEMASAVSVPVSDGTTGVSLNIKVGGFQVIYYYVFWVWLAVFLAIFGFYEGKRLRDAYLYKSITKTRMTEVATYTLDDFNRRVLQGEALVLINDMVIDVSVYKAVHPGGSKILKDSIGTDVTREISGLATITESGVTQRSHKHSSNAWVAMHKHLVGYLEKDEMLDVDETTFDESRRDSSVRWGDESRRRSVSVQSGSTHSDMTFEKYYLVSRIIMTNFDGTPVARFVFRTQEKTETVPLLEPGLYMKFRSIYEGVVVQRSYTIVGIYHLPTGYLGLEMYIRLYPKGLMSKHLLKLNAGDTMKMQGPFFLVGARKPVKHAYMIACGTGVAPMIQYISTNVAQAENQDPKWLGGREACSTMRLIWQLKSDQDCFAAKLLCDLSERAAQVDLQRTVAAMLENDDSSQREKFFTFDCLASKVSKKIGGVRLDLLGSRMGGLKNLASNLKMNNSYIPGFGAIKEDCKMFLKQIKPGFLTSYKSANDDQLEESIAADFSGNSAPSVKQHAPLETVNVGHLSVDKSQLSSSSDSGNRIPKHNMGSGESFDVEESGSQWQNVFSGLTRVSEYTKKLAGKFMSTRALQRQDSQDSSIPDIEVQQAIQREKSDGKSARQFSRLNKVPSNRLNIQPLTAESLSRLHVSLSSSERSENLSSGGGAPFPYEKPHRLDGRTTPDNGSGAIKLSKLPVELAHPMRRSFHNNRLSRVTEVDFDIVSADVSSNKIGVSCDSLISGSDISRLENEMKSEVSVELAELNCPGTLQKMISIKAAEQGCIQEGKITINTLRVMLGKFIRDMEREKAGVKLDHDHQNADNTTIILCGTAAFVDAMENYLIELKIPKEIISCLD